MVPHSDTENRHDIAEVRLVGDSARTAARANSSVRAVTGSVAALRPRRLFEAFTIAAR